MGKAKPADKSGEGKRKSPRPASAAGVRAKIARLDRQLVKLAQERARWSVKASSLHDPAVPTLTPVGGEEEAFERAMANVAGPLDKPKVRSLLSELASDCRALVRPTRIAFLGPAYSYSHLAALYRFGHSVEFLPVANIAAVFEEVNRGHSDFGLVPIENSTDGRIADTLEKFTRLPVRICGEVEMHIHHTLLGKCPRTEVKEVYSRPQALSQCRNWLIKHLPQARAIEVTSTSTAAQLARDKPGAAAIASSEAGVHYGLEVLAERIEDNPYNTTRFAVISMQSSPRSGSDKTAMLFEVEHRPGSLVEALAVLRRHRLNMTWIESFPIPESNRKYMFFVELEGHESDARMRRAIANLQRRTTRLDILGSFPVTPTVG
jgi:chorismate mutase/prephenate dehydratase